MITIYETTVPDDAQTPVQSLLDCLEREGVRKAIVSLKNGTIHIEAVRIMPLKLQQIEVAWSFEEPTK